MAQEDLLEDLVLADAVRLRLVRDLPLDQGREHIAGIDRIARHSVRAGFERGRLRQPHETVLRRDIGGLVRRGAQTVDGGEVDDASPPAFVHLRQHRLREHERRLEHESVDQLPVLERKFRDRVDPLDAGVVDEDVDVEIGALQRRGVRQVDGPRFAADVVGNGLRRVRVDVGDDDGGSGLSEGLGDRFAEPGCSAGDESAFAGEISHEMSLSWFGSVVRIHLPPCGGRGFIEVGARWHAMRAVPIVTDTAPHQTNAG